MQHSNGHRLTIFGNDFDHGVTYAVGDQSSLLNNHLTYDVVVVPGATGTSSQQAVGSFAATLGKPYVVDPRSWLFQLAPERRVDDRLKYARLARQHGRRLEAVIVERALAVRDLEDPRLLEDLVATMLAFQGALEGAASQEKIGQWEKMLGRPIRRIEDGPLPFALIPPYFSCNTALSRNGSDTHGWFDANVRLASIAIRYKGPHRLCPVICLSKSMLRRERSLVIDAYAKGTFDGFFVLVDDLNEHEADVGTLWSFKRFVQDLSEASQKPVMTMAGGYFSLLLYHVGMTGICHGLGYGETRPISGTKVAAGGGGKLPRRYYVPALHRTYPIETADLLLKVFDERFWCRCGLCVGGWSGAAFDVRRVSTPAAQDHFMSTRRNEIYEVLHSSLPQLADRLLSTAHDAQALSTGAESWHAVSKHVGHLLRWADALTDRPSSN